MLEEFVNTNQVPGGGTRRWFSDPQFDLIIWQDDGGNISGFQLCYAKGIDEHAFTWKSSGGYTHHKVDDGEGPDIEHKRSPILVPDGDFNPSALVEKFLEGSIMIDPKISQFVCEKLHEFEIQKHTV